MNILIKTPAEIELMVEGGQRLAVIRDRLADFVKAGVTTGQIEELAVKLIAESGGQSSFKGFHGYPAVSCISVNDEVVHGIPGPRLIKPGDVVGIDVGLKYKEFCTDTAVSVALAPVDPKVIELLTVTKEALAAGIEAAVVGNKIGDISAAIAAVINRHGFGIVRDLTGHGIGRSPHEDPPIPNFGKAGTGPVLEEGMVLAIEPMVTLGSGQVKQLDDGWTIVTFDGSNAAHFEHTIAVSVKGPKILTVK